MANAKLQKQASEKGDYQQELAGIQGDIGAAQQTQNNMMDTMMATAISTAGSMGGRAAGGRGSRKSRNNGTGGLDDVNVPSGVDLTARGSRP